MEIIVKPLQGIFWENNSILLGEKIESVRLTFINTNIRTEFYNSNPSFFLFDNDLRVDFDNNNRVEFIEFLDGLISRLQPLIYGVDFFKTKADLIFELLKNKNCGNITDNSNGYDYQFKNISIGIYREATPQSLLKFISEIQSDANIDKAVKEENIKEEILKANYWTTLGIGTENYYL